MSTKINVSPMKTDYEYVLLRMICETIGEGFRKC
jgi:hypothetical protein